MSPNDTKLKLLLGIGCINLKEFCHVKASEPKYYTILIMDKKKILNHVNHQFKKDKNTQLNY